MGFVKCNFAPQFRYSSQANGYEGKNYINNKKFLGFVQMFSGKGNSSYPGEHFIFYNNLK